MKMGMNVLFWNIFFPIHHKMSIYLFCIYRTIAVEQQPAVELLKNPEPSSKVEKENKGFINNLVTLYFIFTHSLRLNMVQLHNTLLLLLLRAPHKD